MNVLIIGYGHIGKPLFEIVSEKYPAEWADIGAKHLKLKPDILHICYPYSKTFQVDTASYIDRFKPSLCIIESTIPVGTTRILSTLYHNIVHSPVRGREKDDMKRCILTYTKFVGSVHDGPNSQARSYYKSLGIYAIDRGSPADTEAAKLWDTTIRTINISIWNELARFCDKYNIQMDAVRKFIMKGNEETGMEQYRPVHYAGTIGGSCLIPNIDKILEQFDSNLLKAVKDASVYNE